jgi:hypothetical protein
MAAVKIWKDSITILKEKLIKLNAHPEIQQVETMFPDAGRFNQA